MPVDETKEAIARLAVDINYPLDYDMQHLEMTPSENVKAEYARCKDNGDLFRKETRIAQSPEDSKAKWGTPEAARQTYAANKDRIIARRNALLQ